MIMNEQNIAIPMPQDVVGKAGKTAIFIVYKLLANSETEERVKDVCANFSAMIRSIQNRFPEGGFSAVIGFGADAWTTYFGSLGTPLELSPFEEIKGDKHTAVSTPGDLFFHIRANEMGLCYEFASIIDLRLNGVVESIDETHGFRYLDGKSIIGFADGAENPLVDLDPNYFGVIGNQDPAFCGGSYVFVQKYIHDMSSWNATSVEEQEKVIGRRKFNDVELSDAEKPDNAHNAVTNIQDEDGNDLKIIRGNLPFSNTSRGEYGTYFIGYASTFSTTRKMVESMFIGSENGNTDRLLDFSTAVTGTLFFAPSYNLLTTMGDL